MYDNFSGKAGRAVHLRERREGGSLKLHVIWSSVKKADRLYTRVHGEPPVAQRRLATQHEGEGGWILVNEKYFSKDLL